VLKIKIRLQEKLENGFYKLTNQNFKLFFMKAIQLLYGFSNYNHRAKNLKRDGL